MAVIYLWAVIMLSVPILAAVESSSDSVSENPPTTDPTEGCYIMSRELSPIDLISTEINNHMSEFNFHNLEFPLDCIRNNSAKRKIVLQPNSEDLLKKLPRVSGGPFPAYARYVLGQVTFSLGSHHWLQGVVYPLEINFYFYNEVFYSLEEARHYRAGMIGVGLIYRIRDDNAEEEPFFRSTNQSIQFHPKASLPDQMKSYYYYNGSMISSICEESIQWFISKKLGKISSKNLEFLRNNIEVSEKKSAAGGKVYPLEDRKVESSRWEVDECDQIIEKHRPRHEVPDNIDHFFLFIMSIIIFFMQCGFAFMEAGAVKSKNTVNILIKNWLDVCFGALIYWATGFAFTYGSKHNSFVSYSYFFGVGMPAEKLSKWFFNFVFAATAATLVSGALAERCQFIAYIVYSMMITGFIYPIMAHWGWHDSGWLKTRGFHDFAGSGVVHLCGGVGAFIGCLLIGPRIGRFDKNGRLTYMPGHSIPLSALGGFILIFGFLACNGAKQGSISHANDGIVIVTAIVNTVLGTSAAGISTLFVNKMGLVQGTDGTYSLLTTINGSITGTIALCAGCDVYPLWASVVVGAFSGPLYLFAKYFLLRAKIDDPLDAIPVHGGGGLWGLLAVHIFKKDGILMTWSKDASIGLLWNFVGGVSIIAWTSILCYILFRTLKAMKMLRVDAETEFHGMDLIKHGESAYPADAWVERQYDHSTPTVVRNQSNGGGGNSVTSVTYTKDTFSPGGDIPPNMRGTSGAIYNNPEELFPHSAKLFSALRNTVTGAQTSMEKPKTRKQSVQRRKNSIQSEMWMKNLISQKRFEKFRHQSSKDQPEQENESVADQVESVNCASKGTLGRNSKSFEGPLPTSSMSRESTMTTLKEERINNKDENVEECRDQDFIHVIPENEVIEMANLQENIPKSGSKANLKKISDLTRSH